jgi:vitamin B12 transporter
MRQGPHRCVYDGRPGACPSSCADRSFERHAPAITVRGARGLPMKIYLVSTLALSVAAPALAQSTTAQASDDGAGNGSDIVVTATRSGDAIPTSLIGSSVTVISNQDLQDRQTRILSDVLRDVPGVAVNRTGAVGDLTEVRIRGSEANHVLVFVDGIKADDPYYGAYDFGMLVTDEAARVEVLRGQQSSLYGSDAIGGVISYTTLSGREQPGISLRVEGGSMGTVDGGARIAGYKGDFDYALSSSVYRTDGYPLAPGGTLDAHSTSVGASGKFNWAPAPNFKITAVGRYSYTKADTDDQDITASSPIVMGYPVITTVDSPGSYYTNTGYYGLISAQWDVFDGAWTNAASAQIADTTRDGFDFGAASYGDHGRRYRASFNSTVRFGTDRVKNRFTMAVDAERQDFNNTSPGGFSDNSQHRIDTLGFVSQYDLTVDDRLAISASARIDDNSRFNDDSTYRATASYLFPSGTRLHAVYGTGVKDPSASDLFAFVSGQFIGNPNLRPERSKGWEAGLEQNLLANHAKIGATYFDNRFSDEIDQVPTLVDGEIVQTTVNTSGSFKQRGVETYASLNFGDWRFDASYTYLHAPQTVMVLAEPASVGGPSQLPVPVTTQAYRRPKDIASANLTWAPKALPITTTLTVRYNGKHTDYAFNGNFNRLIVDLKSYTLVNLNATYDITSKVQVFARVENLLDKKYQEVFTFATPGRAGYGGVRVKL